MRLGASYAAGMNTRSLGITLVFVAGCAVGGASARLAVPPASAQQAATLTKWEYWCFDDAGEGLARKSNALGAQGWELAAVRSEDQGRGEWCFKRPRM